MLALLLSEGAEARADCFGVELFQIALGSFRPVRGGGEEDPGRDAFGFRLTAAEMLLQQKASPEGAWRNGNHSGGVHVPSVLHSAVETSWVLRRRAAPPPPRC